MSQEVVLRILQLLTAGSLLFLAAGLGCRLLRRGSAAYRHWLWTLAFAGQLALAPLTLFVPNADLPAVSLPAMGTATSALRAPPTAGGAETAGSLPYSAPVSPADVDGGSPIATAAVRAPAGFPWLRAAAVIWAVGAAALLGRLAVELLGLARLRRRASPFATSPGAGRVLLSAEVEIPLTWGVLRPVVVLPAEYCTWPARERRWVLLHEAAHLRRRDPAVNLLAQVVCALEWPNPLAWWASRRLRLESERAADDRVLALGAEPTGYARLLFSFAERLARRRSPAPAMADRAGLGARLRAILDAGTARRRLDRRAALATALAAAAALAVLAAVRFEVRAAPPPEATERPGSPRAAWTLGDREEPAGVDALIEALDDPDAEVRGMACWALGEIKDPRTIEPLARRLGDGDVYVREMALLALGEIENPRALPYLVVQLTAPQPELRAAALWALGEIRTRDALDAVVRGLGDGDAAVRSKAAAILGEKRYRAALPALTERLGDPSPEVRTQAALALGRLRDPAALAALLETTADAEPRVRRAAAVALGLIGDARAVDRLIRVLRDPDADVRSAAVWALDEVHEG